MTKWIDIHQEIWRASTAIGWQKKGLTMVRDPSTAPGVPDHPNEREHAVAIARDVMAGRSSVLGQDDARLLAGLLLRVLALPGGNS